MKRKTNSERKTKDVDLPLFSPRIEAPPPQENERRKIQMSSATAAPPATQSKLYRIGEVSRLTELKPFVLRYWESEFRMLQPVKSPSGHRMYRQEDVDLVLKIKRLLYDEGFTIAGARRHLRDQSSGATEAAGGENTGLAGLVAATGSATQLNRKMLLDLRDALRSFLTLLEGK